VYFNQRVSSLTVSLCLTIASLGACCSDNDLATLPASLVHCSTLTRLTLSGNWQLQGLPPLSADLPSLRHLDASGTGLVTLPSWLSELRGLSELLLASNDMQVILRCRKTGGCWTDVHAWMYLMLPG
jgi:hypothetical protein